MPYQINEQLILNKITAQFTTTIISATNNLVIYSKSLRLSNCSSLILLVLDARQDCEHLRGLRDAENKKNTFEIYFTPSKKSFENYTLLQIKTCEIFSNRAAFEQGNLRMTDENKVHI